MIDCYIHVSYTSGVKPEHLERWGKNEKIT